jgi:adenylate kinase
VLLGRQGAGKGTQAARLAERYGIEHLSTGDLMRSAAAAGVPAGLEARRFMDAGELVPDDVVMRVVEERFAANHLVENGFILDGFPRTLAQAEQLEQVLVAYPLDLVIDMEVPIEVVLDRIAGRRVCEDCGTSYHVNMPPKDDWTCDVCGGRVVQRADDTEEAVHRRLRWHEERSGPVLELYRRLGRLAMVDATGDGDAVYERLVGLIDARCAESRGR